MQLINDTLAELALAAPQNFANLAAYPLIAPPADAGAGSFANEADYLVLDEALQKKLARVTEVSEGGSVPELAFENFAGFSATWSQNSPWSERRDPFRRSDAETCRALSARALRKSARSAEANSAEL